MNIYNQLAVFREFIYDRGLPELFQQVFRAFGGDW